MPTKGGSGIVSERDDRKALDELLAKRPTEIEYLRSIEALAQKVCDTAYDTLGSVVHRPDEASTELERAIAELAVKLRVVHTEGDGCVESADESR